jgi:hypothetical protein
LFFFKCNLYRYIAVDALEPHVREELVGNLTNKELMNYTSVFDSSIAGKGWLDIAFYSRCLVGWLVG